jgi:wobble nucleotide-excising tRNase
VIDDPISSLSHIYIFNVAQYIKHTFANAKNQLKYEQIFILTHSLYFFTELQKITTGEWSNKNKKYYRLTKNQHNKSNFRDLEKNEIQNNYQEYWSIVKDANSLKALVANCMRHIIEHFFGFLGNYNGLSEIEQSMPDANYEAFFRYMNRGSHSDLMNQQIDINEIDVKLWRDYFHDLFEKSGHKKHHDKMME